MFVVGARRQNPQLKLIKCLHNSLMSTLKLAFLNLKLLSSYKTPKAINNSLFITSITQ